MRASIRSHTSRSIAALSQQPATVPNQHHQHVQIRHFPWVPMAYRQGAGATRMQRMQQQRPSGRVRMRTPPPKYVAARNQHQRHKRWNERRSSNGLSSLRDASSDQASQEEALEAHKQSFVKLRRELEQALKEYRQSLAGDVEDNTTNSTTDTDTSTDTNNTNNTNSNDRWQKASQKKAGINKDGASSTTSTTQQVSQLLTAHTDVTPESLDQIMTTEEGYQQLCRLVSDMIALTAKLQVKSIQQLSNDYESDFRKYSSSHSSSNFYGALSEQFLQGLMELQSERAQFVETARHNHSIAASESSASQSMLGWFKSKVLNLSDEKEATESDQADDKKNKSPLLAHEDPLYSPRLEHFQHVASAVHATLQQEEPKSENTNAFRKIRHAQRLQQLLQKMPPSIRDDEGALQSVLQAYALVGSYESARTAERVAAEATATGLSSLSEDLFSTVLQAYNMAARHGPGRNDRVKAVLRAEELVHQKWAPGSNNNIGDGSGIGTEQYNYEEQKFMQCTEVLKCFGFVSSQGLASSSSSKGGGADKGKPLTIPDICQRADSLVGLCIGSDQLDEIFRNGNLGGLWKIAPAHYTLSLLNSLVFVYSASSDASRVNLAKRLLKTLMQDSDLNEDAKVPYPNVHTCKAVLNGILAMHSAALNRGPSSKPLHEFGMELLDLMIIRPHCWPDQSYFHSLFRLLLVSRAENPGKVAEQILSMMYVRECFSSSSQGQDYSSSSTMMVTKKTYHYVLQALLESAGGGNEHAAKKALELVDAMATQALPLLLSPSEAKHTNDSHDFDRYRSFVAPDRSTYELALQICSAVQVPSEKEKALDVALTIHERMKEHGIRPNSQTFSLLFACCDNLLPKDSKRHRVVTQELLTEARNQGNVKESFLKRLKDQTIEILPSNDEEPEEKPAGFSLLSDLK